MDSEQEEDAMMPFRALHQYLYSHDVQTVIDIDISKYFDSINHDMLLAFLRKKINDKRFIRYIIRMLKAGVLYSRGIGGQ